MGVGMAIAGPSATIAIDDYPMDDDLFEPIAHPAALPDPAPERKEKSRSLKRLLRRKGRA